MPSFRGTVVNHQIILVVQVSKPSLKPEERSEGLSFRALLDTGATITAVSQNVVDGLNLHPHGWQPVQGVHGIVNTPTYALNLAVPITEHVMSRRGAAFKTFSRGANLEVAMLNAQPQTFDVLFGMDLLEDFHLTMHADQFIISN